MTNGRHVAPRRPPGDAGAARAGGGARRRPRRRGGGGRAAGAAREPARPTRLAPGERERMVLRGRAAPRWPHLTTAGRAAGARARRAGAAARRPPARRSLSCCSPNGCRRRDAWTTRRRCWARRRTARTPSAATSRSGRWRRTRAPAGAATLLAEAREVLNRRSAAEVEEDRALDGGDGHRAANAAGVAGLRRNAGGAGVARSAARAAAARGGVRADGAGGGAFQSAMATFLWLHENDTDREPAAAAPGARVGRRGACRRPRGVHAHVPPARRARTARRPASRRTRWTDKTAQRASDADKRRKATRRTSRHADRLPHDGAPHRDRPSATARARSGARRGR